MKRAQDLAKAQIQMPILGQVPWSKSYKGVEGGSTGPAPREALGDFRWYLGQGLPCPRPGPRCEHLFHGQI